MNPIQRIRHQEHQVSLRLIFCPRGMSRVRRNGNFFHGHNTNQWWFSITQSQIRCIYEQDKLLKEIQRLQEDFDSVLTRLCHDKAYLDITIIAANLKHITQFEEMTLLKDFEKRGTTFTTRYKTKKHEKMAITMKVNEFWTMQGQDGSNFWLYVLSRFRRANENYLWRRKSWQNL